MNYNDIKFNPKNIFAYYRQDLIDQNLINDQLEVIIDTREKKSEIADIFLEEKINIQEMTLDVADYLFVGGTAFERKSFDFLNYSDVITKASELVFTYPYPYLIVDMPLEKLIAISVKKLHKSYGEILNHMIGLIASLSVRGVPPIFCIDKRTMVRIMISIAKKNLDTKNRLIEKLQGRRNTSNNDAIQGMYANIPGIGNKLAIQLQKQYPTLKLLANATIDDLIKIDKIGRKKAEEIIKIING